MKTEEAREPFAPNGYAGLLEGERPGAGRVLNLASRHPGSDATQNDKT